MASNLKEKTVKGAVWSAVHKFGAIFLSFISSIVLARLLTPEDYGCIGMLAIFMAVANVFIDGGFGSALIQKQRPTTEDYSTILYWNFGFSVFIYLVLFFCAPVISRFYRLPILCQVLRVQSVVLVINALRIVQRNQLRKSLQFKKVAIINLSSSAVALIVTIFFAWKGYGVWALVIQQVLVSVLTTSLYWISAKWHPVLCFSKSSFKQLFNFGGFVLLSNLINTICNNVQGLLIGRLYDPTTMGYYSKAKHTEELSSTFISKIIDEVSYPVLSNAQNNINQLIRIIRKFISVIAYVSFPIMLLLILLAEPIFIFLYSDRWVPSIPYFRILCLAGIPMCLQSINYFAVAAIGKSKVLFVWTIVKRGIGLGLVIGGLLLLGIKGLLLGMVLTSFLIYMINASLVSKHIGYTLRQQFLDLLPIIVFSTLSFGGGFLVTFITGINMYLIGGIQFLVFLGIYYAFSRLFHLKALSSTIEVIGILLKRFRKY